jgi:hypothetical protein
MLYLKGLVIPGTKEEAGHAFKRRQRGRKDNTNFMTERLGLRPDE